MKLKIQTMQGIGDFYWTYRRLSPLVDRLDVDILTTDAEPITNRLLPFLKLFPKVGEVGSRQVATADYMVVSRSVYGIAETLRSPLADFAVNRWLEDGNRLEALDPEYETDWGFVLPDERIELPVGGEYVCVYVSGTVAPFVWTFCQWRLFLRAFQAYDERPFVFVGANWDQNAISNMKNVFPRASFFTHPTPKQLNYVLRNAALFIGYQSGLSSIADAYDVPQIHFCFPQLRAMREMWCKPGHLESGLFKAFTFDQSPNEVLTGLGIQPGASQ